MIFGNVPKKLASLTDAISLCPPLEIVGSTN